MEMTDYDLYAKLRPHLMTNEQVLWYGQPSKKKHFSFSRIFPVIFMIFWLCFAVFWTVMASASDGWFGLFGLPFIAVGIFMFYTIIRDAVGTVYALTDTRILIVNRKTSVAIPLGSMLSINRNFRNDGTGDITFGNQYEYLAERGNQMNACFINIDDAENVARKIDEQIAALRERNE